MMKRCALYCAILGTLLLGRADASPPTRIPFEFDDTFHSGFLSRTCGIPVYVHTQGAGIITLFYDAMGAQIIREIDTLPNGATTTYFSPDTGRSLTQVVHTPVTYVYLGGTDIGDPVIAITNGVQFTSGTGNPRVVGHEMRDGAIVELTPEGFPIVELFDAVSQSGQFDINAVVRARCAILTDG